MHRLLRGRADAHGRARERPRPDAGVRRGDGAGAGVSSSCASRRRNAPHRDVGDDPGPRPSWDRPAAPAHTKRHEQQRPRLLGVGADKRCSRSIPRVSWLSLGRRLADPSFRLLLDEGPGIRRRARGHPARRIRQLDAIRGQRPAAVQTDSDVGRRARTPCRATFLRDHDEKSARGRGFAEGARWFQRNEVISPMATPRA